MERWWMSLSVSEWADPSIPPAVRWDKNVSAGSNQLNNLGALDWKQAEKVDALGHMGVQSA